MLRETASSLTRRCQKCGTHVPSNAVFCVTCGASVNAETTRTAVPAWPAVPPRDRGANEVQRVVFVQHPTLFFVVVVYIAAALVASVPAALSAYMGLPAFVALLFALPFLSIAVLRHLKRNAVRYTLTDSKIEITQGIVVRTTRSIPLPSVQNVTVSTTILQRLLGFGDLVIDDAGAGGGTTILRNIPAPRRHADLLLRELRG